MGGYQHRGHLYTPHTSICPPYCLYICMFPLYHIFPICNGTWGPSVYPICLGVFWRASVHLSDISVSADASICLSVNNSHTSCSPSLWVASLLDWMPMDVCYASHCCSFFVVFSLCLKLLLPWL